MSSKRNKYKPQIQVPDPQPINRKFKSREDIVLDDIAEINYPDHPPLPPQQFSNNKHLVELQDQEPYNRRQSFLHDLHHEPYWQNEPGRHPFETPKHSKTSMNGHGFFNKDVQTNNNKKSNTSSHIHSDIHYSHLHDPSTSNSNATVTENTLPQSNNTSQEMAIIQEQDMIHKFTEQQRSTTHSTDIYSNDDTPNHNGRITTFARNGQMNPISLYKIDYDENEEDLENDSYEDSHSDLDEMPHMNVNHKNVNRNLLHLSKDQQQQSKKKSVSFAGMDDEKHQIHSNVSSGSSGPHSLMQSGDALNIPLHDDVMAITSPLVPQQNEDSFTFSSHLSNGHTPQTAPSSPHKKYKYSPQVSSIKNQRHSVVSIAMIEKIRADNNRKILHIQDNNGVDMSEELDDSIFYNNDHHKTPIPSVYAMQNNHHHQTPYIQRSGTENDILHNQQC